MAADGEQHTFALLAHDMMADGNLEIVRGVAYGPSAGCVVTGEGRVRCWGRLDTSPRTVWGPTGAVLEGFEDVIEIGIGERHVCARDSAGRVRCFGERLGIGDGPPAAFDFPLPAPAVDVASSGHVTCAVLRDGSAWCLGSLGYYGVGREAPERVEALEGPVCRVAVSERAACFVGADGSLSCMGNIGDWYYADVDEEDEERGPVSRMEMPLMRPERVELRGRAVEVAVANDHACALTSAGGLECVGAPYRDGRTEGFRARIAAPLLRSGVTDVAGGAGTCVVRGGGLHCFYGGEALSNGVPGSELFRACDSAHGEEGPCVPLRLDGSRPEPAAAAPAPLLPAPGCTFRVRDPSGTPLNVRAEPSARSAVTGTLENGTAVQVGDPRGRWRPLIAPIEGWVWADNVACE